MSSPPSPSEKPEIGVRNLHRKLQVDVPALRAFAERALTTCLAQGPIRETPLHKLRQISVLLISDRRMKALHRRFLGKSALTDVITFDHGEIFISTETAR